VILGVVLKEGGKGCSPGNLNDFQSETKSKKAKVLAS